MSDELREKVIETMFLHKAANDAVDAAIALIRGDVLEEAAKVVDALEPPEGNTHSYGMYWEDGAGAAADAIRALKDKP